MAKAGLKIRAAEDIVVDLNLQTVGVDMPMLSLRDDAL